VKIIKNFRKTNTIKELLKLYSHYLHHSFISHNPLFFKENRMKKKAFTLIELLIVVAIIAILAAIAVPNFLEAQTRAKVSRSKADMRTCATAIESYVVDYNKYPPSNYYSYAFSIPSLAPGGGGRALEVVTTPIAYISSGAALTDPFVASQRYSSSNFEDVPSNPKDLTTDPRDVKVAILYHYMARNEGGAATTDPGDEPAKWWFLESCGPDRAYHSMSGIINQSDDKDVIKSTQYDPTNGTVSRGSVFRLGGGNTPLGENFYRACFSNQK
jgi:general secretion pathway protein G